MQRHTASQASVQLERRAIRHDGSRSTTMFALATAMIAATVMACAPARYGADSEPGVIDPAPVVRIVNETTRPYRVSLVYEGFVRTLGVVPALDRASFALPRKVLWGYEAFQLRATLHDGTDRRDSEQFTFSGVSFVLWRLDAMRTRNVNLR
jgi:hypothetical protein